MTIDLAEFKRLHQSLRDELTMLEDQVPLLIERRDQLRDVFNDVRSPGPEAKIPAPKAAVVRQKGTKRTTKVRSSEDKVHLYIKNHPGVSRHDINEAFRDEHLDRTALDSIIGRLRKNGAIQNTGTNRASAWVAV